MPNWFAVQIPPTLIHLVNEDMKLLMAYLHFRLPELKAKLFVCPCISKYPITESENLIYPLVIEWESKEIQNNTIVKCEWILTTPEKYPKVNLTSVVSESVRSDKQKGEMSKMAVTSETHSTINTAVDQLRKAYHL